MRRRFAKFALYIALVFQLALGTAVPGPAVAMAHGASEQSAAACPQHVHQRQSALEKHDCCHLSGCLHHCTPTAGPTVGLLAWTAAFAATYLLPPREQPVPLTQFDELFRPPIA